MITTSIVRGEGLSVGRHLSKTLDKGSASNTAVGLLLLSVIGLHKVFLANGCVAYISCWSAFHVHTASLYLHTLTCPAAQHIFTDSSVTHFD
jgi:hypothetical protein